MNENLLVKITAATAAEVCQHYKLSDSAKNCLTEGSTPASFIWTLVEQNLFPDAIRFLAFALPRREAVWWACVCTRMLHDQQQTVASEQADALAAAEAWVYKPNEENRRIAGEKADQTERQYPADWTASAAFWSGGNISAAGQAIVQPPDHLCPHAIASAVLLAAAEGDSAELHNRYRDYLTRGIDIAKGGTGRGKDKPT